MDQPLTTSQVARVFDVNTATVWRWARTSRIETLGQFGDTITAPLMYDPVTVQRFGMRLKLLAAAKARA